MTQPTNTDYIDSRWAWYGVTILFLAYTCSFIDRTILALLVEPIKRDLVLTDTQFSLLHGLAFALFYTFMGIPISRLADQYSRRLIIGTGIFIWSLMTAVCGMTKNFWQLFGARVGVGIGEAALSPAAYSLIADYFPPAKLGRALGVYSSGICVGAGLAFVVGGAVIQLVSDLSTVNIPGIGPVAPWQSAFFIVGLPGLILVLLMATIPEPQRHLRSANHSRKTNRTIPIREVVNYLKENWQVYLSHYIGYPMNGLVFGLVMAWGPSYFIRSHGLTASEVGYYLGTIIIVFGTIGLVIGGWLGDKLQSLGYKDGMFRVGALASLLACPLAVMAPLMSNLPQSLGCYALLVFFTKMGFATGPAALQLCTPNLMRAQASALFLFFLNVIAIGMAPTATALVTDYIFQDEMKVGYALAIVGGSSALIAGLTLWLGRKHYGNLAESTT